MGKEELLIQAPALTPSVWETPNKIHTRVPRKGIGIYAAVKPVLKSPGFTTQQSVASHIKSAAGQTSCMNFYAHLCKNPPFDFPFIFPLTSLSWEPGPGHSASPTNMFMCSALSFPPQHCQSLDEACLNASDMCQ